MIEWRDSGSGKDKDGTPRVVEARIGRFRLCVHRHVHYEPDQWLASCPGLFENMDLAPKDIESAKCQAVAKFQVILEEALDQIRGNGG